MKRKIIKIDEEKCNGCGVCIPNCPEGALQIIDGKARLVSELFCDGLGACIGNCPQGAISIEEREAQEYDEKKAMENIIKKGTNLIKAHLLHLKEHNQTTYLKQAIEFLEEKNLRSSLEEFLQELSGSCNKQSSKETILKQPSQLQHWPIQLRLIDPLSAYYKGKDIVLVADCVAYALGNFSNLFLREKALLIACPKLDKDKYLYINKLKILIEGAKINTLTVITMEVACCKGLLLLSKEALELSKRKAPLKYIVVSIKGEILKEEWQ